jgi:hypothetical protein
MIESPGRSPAARPSCSILILCCCCCAVGGCGRRRAVPVFSRLREKRGQRSRSEAVGEGEQSPFCAHGRKTGTAQPFARRAIVHKSEGVELLSWRAVGQAGGLSTARRLQLFGYPTAALAQLFQVDHLGLVGSSKRWSACAKPSRRARRCSAAASRPARVRRRWCSLCGNPLNAGA